MNYVRRSLITFTVLTVTGIVALLVALLGNLPDGYRMGVLSGVASGFLTVGVVGLITSARLIKNPQRAKEIEIAKNEERSQFIRMKTNASTYSATLVIETAGTLVAALLGFKGVSITLAILLFAQFAFYMGFICHYSKKY